jgi:hypothetical protein
MVMVDNGKDMATMASDLEELIGKGHATALAAWLGGALAATDSVAGEATADAAADAGEDEGKNERGNGAKPEGRYAGGAGLVPRGGGWRPAGHLLASALAGATRGDPTDNFQQVRSNRRVQSKLSAAGRAPAAAEQQQPVKVPLSARLGARVSEAAAAELTALQAQPRAEKRDVQAAAADDVPHYDGAPTRACLTRQRSSVCLRRDWRDTLMSKGRR